MTFLLIEPALEVTTFIFIQNVKWISIPIHERQTAIKQTFKSRIQFCKSMLGFISKVIDELEG